MKRVGFALVWAVALGIAADRASAVVVFQDNFDSYTTGTALTGQGGWTTAPTASASGNLSTTQKVSTPNSVNMGTAASGNRHTFAETNTLFPLTTPNNSVSFSFDFYEGAPEVEPYRQFSNIMDGTASTSTNGLISMGLTNSMSSTASGGNYFMARIVGFSPPAADPDGGPGNALTVSGAFFKLNDFGVGLRSTGWHNLKVVITTDNALSTDYFFYVNNVLAEQVSNVGTAASIRSYDLVQVGSALSSTTQGFFDNVLITAVPEVSSFLAVGLVGLSSLGIVWIRKKRAIANVA